MFVDRFFKILFLFLYALSFTRDSYPIARKSGDPFFTTMTLGGQSPDKAFGTAGLAAVAQTVGGVAANEIGESYGKQNLSYAEHKALHALAGAGAGAILNHKDPLRGALAEVIAEAAMGNPQTWLLDMRQKHINLSPIPGNVSKGHRFWL